MSEAGIPKRVQGEAIGPFLPEIRRARYDRLTIYEVEESELTILERGSPDSIYLNFAVALLSVAISLTATLATAAVPSERTFVVLVVVAVVGYTVGSVLLSLWWRSRTSTGACVRTIRNRLVREWLPDVQTADVKASNDAAEQDHEAGGR